MKPMPSIGSGWRAAAIAAAAAVAALFMVIRPPSTAQASEQKPTAVMGAPAAEYVSSDPSLVPAASVKFAEPGPHIEAF